MRFYPLCDLLTGNHPDENQDDQYCECEECHRFDICKAAYERWEPYDSYIESLFKELQSNLSDNELMSDTINNLLGDMKHRIESIRN